MRESMFVTIGFCLSACATTGSQLPAPAAAPQAVTAPITPADSAVDVLSCARSIEHETTCPVLGGLTDADRAELAIFVQDNHMLQDMQENPVTLPEGKSMQATDDN